MLKEGKVLMIFCYQNQELLELLKASRAISKKCKKIRHKKNDELQFIKQIYQCI